MAGTDTSKASPAGPAPCVILVNPQLGENIGTAARAMANFGLSALRIVEPRDGWPNPRAVSAASGADEVIEKAEVFERLSDAVADLDFVYATTARPRGMIKKVLDPELAGSDMRARIGQGQRVGILFGRERWGLDNDEVAQADVIVTAPVNPAFASLNIAQAVLLIGYEWYRGQATSLGLGTAELKAIEGPGLRAPDTRPATKAELEGFFLHLEGELDQAGFYKTAEKRPGMVRNMRNLFARAELTEQEVRSLRGVVSSLCRSHLKPRQEGPE